MDTTSPPRTQTKPGSIVSRDRNATSPSHTPIGKVTSTLTFSKPDVSSVHPYLTPAIQTSGAYMLTREITHHPRTANHPTMTLLLPERKESHY